MPDAEPLIRNVSDTARWVAAYRAMETARPDALFKDPFAHRLMGERGPLIAKEMQKSIGVTWPFVSRTVVFDELIMEEVAAGCDLVVNLAAGLDARPYRMTLPPSLMWVEIDLPGIIDEKEKILRDDKPVCKLERIRLDLANVAQRRKVFADLGALSRRALVLSEGLTIYLAQDDVSVLARDLSNVPSFSRWITDLTSPGLLRMMLGRGMGRQLSDAGAPFKFAPQDGPDFFTRHGWRATDVRSLITTAGKLGRLNFPLNILWRIPNSGTFKASRPWSAVLLLERS